MPHQPQSEVELAHAAAAEHFYSGALQRVSRVMAVLSFTLPAAVWWKYGFRAAIGFGFGCGIAFLNFHWLKKVIAAFVDRATGTETSETGRGIVFRFLLRYVLMAIGAYAILTVSPASLNGLLAGLFLPVAAIACEAFYELYAAFVRGV
jgi:small-conductance mechanosensitive channel